MKALLLLLFISFSQLSLHAQNVNFSWARQFGGPGSVGKSYVKADAGGNVYTAGSFTGTVDFDPGIGVFNLNSIGNWDIFVCKFDANGTLTWAKRMGGPGEDICTGLALDGMSNVYTTGHFIGTSDFDPGPSFYNMIFQTWCDFFVSKLSSAGNFVWAKQFGEAAVGCTNNIATDASGNVYLNGNFSGAADFDPGPANYDLVSTGPSDIFVSRLDAGGNFIWAKQVELFTSNYVFDIAIDGFGNVLTTGDFGGAADFDPGPGTNTLTSAGDYDAYILKLDAAGNLAWVAQVGGVNYDAGFAIATDLNGTVFATGTFQGTVDFDPGPGNYSLISSGANGSYIMRLDIAGNLLWAKSIEQAGGSSIWTDIAVDQFSHVYSTGNFTNTVDFDPGPVLYDFTSHGQADVFISKLDDTGNFLWAKQIGDLADEIPSAIAVDNTGSVYSTGTFTGMVDFNPGTGVYNLLNIGTFDIYVHKMNRCLNSSSVVNATVCTSYTLNGQTYLSSGIYTQTLVNATGCDSLLTLNLTINRIITTLNAAACYSYTWNGTTYTMTGVYGDTLTAANGCDSVSLLQLTIKQRTYSLRFVTICSGQTYAGHNATGIYKDTLVGSNGCDSIATLDLTVLPAIRTTINRVICSGQSYGGHTTAGTYIDTLHTPAGCDSIRTLVLDVQSVIRSSVNATICAGQDYGGHTTPGTYIDTLRTSGGCDSVRTLILDLNPASFSSISAEICPGQDYLGHSLPGVYKDTLIAANGCDSIRTLTLTNKVNCIPFAIPNAFTPNNDGWNDVFKPIINKTLLQYHFIIFNRYGQKLFESRTYGESWDGTWKGKAQPMGTYVYHLRFTTISGYEEDYNGSALLLR